MKKRFSEEQIIGFLRGAEAGPLVQELCSRHGFSPPEFLCLASQVLFHRFHRGPTCGTIRGGIASVELARQPFAGVVQHGISSRHHDQA